MTTAVASGQKTKQSSAPKKDRWEYFANEEEKIEYEKLQKIRRVINRSQRDFEEGRCHEVTPGFFEKLKKEAEKQSRAKK